MLFVPCTADALGVVKNLARAQFKGVRSSHLTEALAAGAGENTQASLLATIASGRKDALVFEDESFRRRLGELGYTSSGWPSFKAIAQEGVGYRSARREAWRNMLVAAVNAGISQGVFGLGPNENFWSSPTGNRGQGDGATYEVHVPGIPARAYVYDIGFDELAIHVAYWPRADGGFLRCGNGGLSAGDAFAVGWLERRTGRWLQAERRGVGSIISIRRARVSHACAAAAPALGYKDSGKFFM